MKQTADVGLNILAAIGLLGKFYAVPAVAQAVEAALVQYRDSPLGSRSPSAAPLHRARAQKHPAITFPAVLAGKRMIVTSVAGAVNIVVPPAETCAMAMTTTTGFKSYQVLPLTSRYFVIERGAQDSLW